MYRLFYSERYNLFNYIFAIYSMNWVWNLANTDPTSPDFRLIHTVDNYLWIYGRINDCTIYYKSIGWLKIRLSSNGELKMYLYNKKIEFNNSCTLFLFIQNFCHSYFKARSV